MRNRRFSPYELFTLIAIIASVGIGLLITWITDWQPYFIWLATINVVTFLFFGFDKSQARAGGGRIPEIVLLSLIMLGGFFGGWLGRAIFHHKTRKQKFLVVLIISTFLHLFIFYWFFLRN